MSHTDAPDEPLPANATFLIFKDSGKYYDTARGHLSKRLFDPYYRSSEARGIIVQDNGGRCPGLSTSGEGMVIVVMPDESLGHGWPIILDPQRGR